MSLESDRPWSLTPQALERLLRRLSPEAERAGQEYESIRRNLVTFLQLRGSLLPEDLADETIDRVARKLEEGEPIKNLRAYLHGVAKRVVLESQRREIRQKGALDGLRPFHDSGEDLEREEARDVCLERCLGALPEHSRTLIMEYHDDTGAASAPEGRKLLAERLGIPYASLKGRAHRIRNQLENCMRGCLDGEISVTNRARRSL